MKKETNIFQWPPLDVSTGRSLSRGCGFLSWGGDLCPGEGDLCTVRGSLSRGVSVSKGGLCQEGEIGSVPKETPSPPL